MDNEAEKLLREIHQLFLKCAGSTGEEYNRAHDAMGQKIQEIPVLLARRNAERRGESQS